VEKRRRGGGGKKKRKKGKLPTIPSPLSLPQKRGKGGGKGGGGGRRDCTHRWASLSLISSHSGGIEGRKRGKKKKGGGGEGEKKERLRPTFSYVGWCTAVFDMENGGRKEEKKGQEYPQME